VGQIGSDLVTGSRHCMSVMVDTHYSGCYGPKVEVVEEGQRADEGLRLCLKQVKRFEIPAKGVYDSNLERRMTLPPLSESVVVNSLPTTP